MKLSLNALYNHLLEDLVDYLPGQWFDPKNIGPKPYQSGFDHTDEEVMSQLTPEEFAACSLMASVLKKNQDLGTSEQGDQVALDKFKLANISCSDWSLKPTCLQDEHLIGAFRQCIDQFFYPTCSGPGILSYTDEFIQLGGVGPGASIGARGTDFYTKLFDGPLSCTAPGLYRLYRNNCRYSVSYTEGEETRSGRYGEYEVVEGSKLGFVPKNDHESRTICTEPVLNMIAQKGIGELISRRLKKAFGIDLSTQPEINRELARLGSLDDTLATVDLSSASDTIGLSMCREFLPESVMASLSAVRSKMTRVPPALGGETLELHMVGSMGNGFTFPLETAIFACVVEAAYKVLDLKLVRSNWKKRQFGNFAVFGDDIICLADAAPQVYRLLEMLGFTVNASKSFVKGPFRESCGADFFRGQPVRGVYIKTLRTLASRYVAINRLNQWTGETGLALPNTVQWLLKHVRLLPVPLHENDDAGIKVTEMAVRKLIFFSNMEKGSPMFYEMAHEHGLKAVLCAKSLGKRTIMHDFDTSAWLYKRWIAKPYEVKFNDEAVVTPKRARKRYYNAEGALQAFLRGDIKEGKVAIRHDRVTYLTRRAKTPHWDLVPSADAQASVGSERWDSALWLNLTL